MKESGINYFYDELNLDTGAFAVYYAFEAGAGNVIPITPSGQVLFSGVLDSIGPFWSKPGSGFFSGNSVTITNSSGLQSDAWTDIFSYEKIDTKACILFDSLGGGSGYRIGITEANKPYFESFNAQPILAASLNNYSSKNLVSFTYIPNYLTIGYYDFNAKVVESETFTLPFQVIPSDVRRLGGQFTGYMDTYIHITDPLSTQVQAQWFSGFWAIPTGTITPISQICTTGITGYQNVFVFSTGITGYVTTPGGDEGRDYFTGQFPTYYTQVGITGYLSSGTYSSGVGGISCYPVTGAPEMDFSYLSGYASSFGMQKVQLLSYVQSGDLIKQSVSRTPWDSRYNVVLQRQYSGYLSNASLNTGWLNAYLNGVAQANQGYTLTGDYIIVTGAQDSDSFFFDLKSGDMNVVPVTGLTGYAWTYSGQEIYLNGVNLISGYDFVVNAGSPNLTSRATGITGYLSEYPIVLPSSTGSYTLWTGAQFGRNTTNLYLNGIRQQNRSTYFEGAAFDLLSGNSFNPADCTMVYDNTDLYWE